MTHSHRSGKKGPDQLPLAFPVESAAGREDLVVSDPVSAAAAIIDRWPDWPSPVVIITGPQGSGKTHLAQVWQDFSHAVAIHPDGSGEAVPLAGAGPVLFEDADRRGFDETEFFHVINAVRSAGTTLLVTARAWPLSWGVRLPDLSSRLKAATTVEIGPPDDLLLTQIFFKLFADRQLVIDERLVAYMVSRMERSLASAQAIVERLDLLALARGTRITRSLVAEVLDEVAGEDQD
ncbi:DnaA regulatory inactivator HdaA [Rhizobium alvei]|uniref:DnaA regulatory inactivator HdaA n=1 Tax=Rhizobium alvei TaxID=1132659 RepID=A0ABT8YJ72_9HYPH|nr:DnaA regulatory inactivator HdaA [Rhizobium alvei]MDO6963735.1 DnaA regulatory inactivator HdaA [Rhizobium alvei]